MASKGAIGVIRELALKRLTAAMERISQGAGVEAVNLPTFRDPAYQEAMQLEALAAWAEGVAETIAPLESMSVAQLRAYADLKRVELGPARRKADIIAVLRGEVTEEAPAATPSGEDQTPTAEPGSPIPEWLPEGIPMESIVALGQAPADADYYLHPSTEADEPKSDDSPSGHLASDQVQSTPVSEADPDLRRSEGVDDAPGS